MPYPHGTHFVDTSDVIMGTMTSQITSLTIVHSTVYSGADQRKYQSSVSLAFVRGIHRWPVNFPHKGPVLRIMLPFDDVIMDILKKNNSHCDKYFVWKKVFTETNVYAFVCDAMIVSVVTGKFNLCSEVDVLRLDWPHTYVFQHNWYAVVFDKSFQSVSSDTPHLLTYVLKPHHRDLRNTSFITYTANINPNKKMPNPSHMKTFPAHGEVLHIE